MPNRAEPHPPGGYRRRRRRRRSLLAIIPLLLVAALLPGWTQRAASMLAGHEALIEGPITPLSTDPDPPTEGRPPERRRQRDPGRLRRAVQAAFLQASSDAAAEGIELTITSGYRSPEHQRELFEEAVRTYGEEAERWVLPPERSMHVRGIAIDVAPRSGAEWLALNGARYGLCRTYSWEWWHFEYRPARVLGGACPPAAT